MTRFHANARAFTSDALGMTASTTGRNSTQEIGRPAWRYFIIGFSDAVLPSRGVREHANNTGIEGCGRWADSRATGNGDCPEFAWIRGQLPVTDSGLGRQLASRPIRIER